MRIQNHSHIPGSIRERGPFRSGRGYPDAEQEGAPTPGVPPPLASATEVTATGKGIPLSLVGASLWSEAPTPEEWLRIFLVDDRAVIGILDLHIGESIHGQFGTARVTASGPGMRSPSQPGLSTHSAPDWV